MKTWLPLFLLSFAFASQCFASNIGITTPTLPNGTVDTTYSEVIKASGGCTPYKWAIASGALPAGVTAKASSTTTVLDLSGKPTKAATYSFAVKATGCGGKSSQVSYKLVIQATAEHVVDLSWKASTSRDVSGYNIYRGATATTMKKVNASPIASTAYTDSSVANGSTYYYATTAVDTEGRESSKTPAIKAVIP
ncbi:MAG: putative Ig domain-containing protein [Candidatus Sulfotelmatobacter sp.]